MHSEIGSYSEFLSNEEKHWPDFGRKQGEKLVLLLRRLTVVRTDSSVILPSFTITCLHRQTEGREEFTQVFTHTGSQTREIASIRVDLRTCFSSVEESDYLSCHWVGRKSRGSVESVSFETGFGSRGGAYDMLGTLESILNMASHHGKVEISQVGEGERRFFNVTRRDEVLATLHPVRQYSTCETFVIDLC
jgi:hypothetical protein